MKKANAFLQRDETLKTLGFNSYEEYLLSSLWTAITRALLGSPHAEKCACCKSRTGLVWHHTTYDLPVLVGNFSEADGSLVRLCTRCHNLVHYDEKEFVGELDDVSERLGHLKYLIEQLSSWEDVLSAMKGIRSASTENRRLFDEWERYAKPDE